ncbi:MAG: ABC transporter [Micrococcales bacterium]|nr:MAG: ABC transporter [Micrococcales bacterium]
MTTPVLQADQLTKRFGTRVALRGVTLHVEPGEVVGLLGPNGAGKSTTVKIVSGLVKPSSGSARLFGQPSSSPAARRRLGYLPELFRFPDWMTGEQVLRLHAELAGVTPAQRSNRVGQVLERVGLGARGKDRVRGYSKGMSQRLGLAQALVGKPELLLLDEPTSAMDPVGRREVRDLVAELRSEGVAVLLNSHLLSEVEQVCDRVAVVDHGRMRFEGRLADLVGRRGTLEITVARPDDSLTHELLDFGTPHSVSPGRLQLQLGPPWDDDIAVATEMVAARVATGPWGLLGLSASLSSLEDAFVSLVQGGDK